jgi:uncharacterized protein (TIGR02594 family)
MRLIKKRAAILLCSVAVAALATSAFASPVRHHRHRAAEVAQTTVQPQNSGADRDMRYSLNAAAAATDTAATVASSGSRRRGQHVRVMRDPRLATEANASFIAAQSHSNSAYGGFSTNELVAEARKYIGTNPTGRGSLWCGAFMDLVLKRTGHAGGGNLASAYAHYGTRVSGPQVGAIAVMGRRGGGHVGVVSGIDPNGNPIIISGNHNHTTAEAVYPRTRISAYVVPGS